MRRITTTLKKAHGAFKPFTAALSDAIFIVSAEDVKTMDSILAARGMSPAEISKYKLENWRAFVKVCRRYIPPTTRLLQRFRRVCEAYGGVYDVDLKETLFASKATGKAVSHCHLRALCQ
jgi:hypothetical protein